MSHNVETALYWCDEHDLPVDKWQNHCRQGELRLYIEGQSEREYDCQLVRGRFVRCLHGGGVCDMTLSIDDAR